MYAGSMLGDVPKCQEFCRKFAWFSVDNPDLPVEEVSTYDLFAANIFYHNVGTTTDHASDYIN
jgi:hypothetical protein